MEYPEYLCDKYLNKVAFLNKTITQVSQQSLFELNNYFSLTSGFGQALRIVSQAYVSKELHQQEENSPLQKKTCGNLCASRTVSSFFVGNEAKTRLTID